MKPEIFKEMEYTGETISNNPIVLCFDIYKDYPFYIFSLGAHPTAYIVLSETDKLYNWCNVDLDNVADVHGGFTYTSNILTGPDYSYVNEYEKKWVIGWDYGHYCDWTSLMSDEANLMCNNKKWTTQEILDEVYEAIDMIVKYNEEE